MREFEISVADTVASDEDTGAVLVDLGHGPIAMSFEEAHSLAAALTRAADTAALRALVRS